MFIISFEILIHDITYYSTWGFLEKVLSMLGIQLMIIPLYLYAVFEYVVEKMGGITYKSVFWGGILSSVGMLLGVIFLIM